MKISKEVYALKSSASVSGVSRKKTKLGVVRPGDSRVEDGTYKVTVAHEKLHHEARKIATAIAGLKDAFGVYSDAVDAYLTDASGVRQFEAALAKLREEADEFSAQPGNPHAVTIAEYSGARPYSTTFTASDFAGMYAAAGRELTGAREALRAGDPASVTNWLKRNQRLAAGLPALNTSAVETAIKALRESCNAMAAELREGTALDAIVAAAEFVEMDEAVSSALGWLAPAAESTDSAANG
jgi:hypothetical protein